MRALDSRAKSAGVFLLQELGLDPGIDRKSIKSAVVIDSSACGGREPFIE